MFDNAAAAYIVVLYVTFMARTCCAASIRNYLAAVRAFYLSRGLPNPAEGNYRLRQCLKGIKRAKGDGTPNRKLPITVAMLQFFRVVRG